VPKITTKFPLLFTDSVYPSITVLAGKLTTVPDWVLKTNTFKSHLKAGSLTVEAPPVKVDPPAPPAPPVPPPPAPSAPKPPVKAAPATPAAAPVTPVVVAPDAAPG
jgi:hypothetical protein